MDKNFSFFSETPEELEKIFESGRKYRQEIFDQTFQSDLNKFQENLQNVITKEVENNSQRSEKNVKRNYTENFPTVTNNNKNKITNQRRGKYNFHKSPSKIKDSNKKVLFNSFFNNNEIVAEKNINSFKPKNENNFQFSNFLQNNLNNNFPSKFNEFQDIERLSSNIDQINDKVVALNQKEFKNSKLLYSSVLKFPENENSSCKNENSILVKVEENKISTKKTLIEKIEISSMSNMEKLLKKIEENEIKMAEITKIDFKNLPRIVSGENFNRKIEEDKIMLQLSDLGISFGDENLDDGQIEDFDALEKIYLEEFDFKFL